MTPISSMSGQDDGKEFFIVGFESNDPGEKIYNWYEDEFNAGGWQIDFESSSSSDGLNYYQITAENDVYFTSVAITEESDSTTSVALNAGAN